MNQKHTRRRRAVRRLVFLLAPAVLGLGLLLLWPDASEPESIRAAEQHPADVPLTAASTPAGGRAPSNALPAPPTETRSAPATPVTEAAVEAEPGRSREFDLSVNPYAAGLRQPGGSKRAWDADFLESQASLSEGDSIAFELTGGVLATGTVRIVQRDAGGITYLSGDLGAPETGTFFFLRPPEGGRAGSAVGVIEFPAGRTAYRIEPTGENGSPELWQRRLDEVLCMNLPPVPGDVWEDASQAPPLRPDLVPEYVPDYNSNIVSLQSLPGARGVILLDYFGGYTASWGGVHYSAPDVSNADIREVWKRVAEDYLPLNINVTTDLKVYEAAPEGSRQRCVFAPDAPTAAGVAYFGSWNWGGDTVCWARYTTGKGAAEVGSHEVGHTLGLSHQTQDPPGEEFNEYYGGHDGPGTTGWAPIMGVGYYQPVTSWARGEYQYAGDNQDELAVMITYNDVDYRADEAGASLGTSRHLEIADDFTASAEGVIQSTGDSDAFRFTTDGGSVDLTAGVVGDWANLALTAEIQDSGGLTIASNNPQDALSATISTALAAGTYTFKVTGTGRNDPRTNGFSDYASLGYYAISGSVAGARLPSRFTIPESLPNGSVVGVVTSTNQGIHPLTYVITAGNSDTAFALDHSGVLVVANTAALDYEPLAYGTQQTVQYDLLVDIIDTVDPSRTEFDRRVVVEVIDEPEPSADLVHRWSFDNGIDSVGGATASLVGAASFTGGRLQIPGGPARVNCATVNLTDTLATNASLTIEGWFTMNTLQNWSKVWMFGRPNGGIEPALAYLDFTPRAGVDGNVPSLSLNTGLRPFEFNTRTGANPATLTTGVEYHAVAVYDVESGLMSLYLDGVRVDCASLVEANVSQLAATEAFFGAAVHYNDPNLDGAINELRIYHGAVTPWQAAINRAAGPDTIVTDPGALVAVRLVVPDTNMVSLATQQVLVFADYAHVTNVNITTAGAVLSSGNPNVVAPGPSGEVRAMVPGTTTLTASFGGLDADRSVTVTTPPTVLAHRWSFNNGTDSVGDADASLIGAASYSGGRLVLPGGEARSNCASVDIADTLRSTVSLTIESWFTMDALQDWAKVWMFGTEASEAGEPWLAYIGCTPRAGVDGKVPSLSFNPASGNEVNTRPGPNPAVLTNGGEYHVVAAYDAAMDRVSFYLNGVLVDSAPMGGGNITGLGADPNEGYFGAAVNFPDPCLDGSIDEIRVWKGVLPASHVAFNTSVGPDTAVSDPGDLTDVRLEVPAHNLTRGSSQLGTVFADFSNYPDLNVTGSGVDYVSSNPGIVSVSASGVIRAVGVGSATITAAYGGLEDSALITVVGAPGLVHRWSFDDGTDSVGGAHASLLGSAAYGAGQLHLPGGAARVNCAAVDIADTLAATPSLTIEGWFTMDALQNWSKVWMFGTPNGGVQPGLAYVGFTPRRGDGTAVPSMSLDTAFEAEINTAGGSNPGLMVTGTEYHAAAVYDAGNDLMTLYINGALADSASMNGRNITQVQATEAWFGAAVHWPDPNLNGSINEIRIWDGPLTPAQVAAHHQLGPNLLPRPDLTVVSRVGAVEISWPGTFPGFTLESTPALPPIPVWSPVAVPTVLSNGTYTVTLPATNPAGFFRLTR